MGLPRFGCPKGFEGDSSPNHYGTNYGPAVGLLSTPLPQFSVALGNSKVSLELTTAVPVLLFLILMRVLPQLHWKHLMDTLVLTLNVVRCPFGIQYFNPLHRNCLQPLMIGLGKVSPKEGFSIMAMNFATNTY
ncbi:uncharacterized protein LOC122282749 isoform X2 [Carya illinoinensis]|uniref:uncharacterized protein LOC122282749 isoform X2 n=1 Tax=Carya illinoinensis TaxID=32201 RepID=UPI001C7225F9|nr:uncharacterized protein LOC122282749 isoform X2 [Carya illinoinensis]